MCSRTIHRESIQKQVFFNFVREKLLENCKNALFIRLHTERRQVLCLLAMVADILEGFSKMCLEKSKIAKTPNAVMSEL